MDGKSVSIPPSDSAEAFGVATARHIFEFGRMLIAASLRKPGSTQAITGSVIGRPVQRRGWTGSDDNSTNRAARAYPWAT
jgi:hypothetical protein